MSFSENFVWGAATASYQIEGAASEDGKGQSIWDVFSHTTGKIWNDHHGDVACNHYHRMEEDVRLMGDIGLQAYRFSLSWPRILPDGTGEVNEGGLDFYDGLVDALLAANIQPYITLYHWDLPYALYKRGGWLNRDIADWFANYTEIVSKRLGDRVKNWITLNEPGVFINAGYRHGRHAPGDKRPDGDILRIIHHSSLAHGRAVQVLRKNVADSNIGISHATVPTIPANDSEPEIQAAAKFLFEDRVGKDAHWSNLLWLDPIIKGAYPPEVYEHYGEHMPDFPEADLSTIAQPIDFIGLNIYFGSHTYLEDGMTKRREQTHNQPITRFDWPVQPELLYWGPRHFYERYNLPIYITENGLSSMDWVTLDGTVPDVMRIDFTRRYLREYRRAAADGVDVRGYFHWSLMDNFEWALGYRERFGLIYVDFDTQERTLKDSAKWYHTVIEANGENL